MDEKPDYSLTNFPRPNPQPISEEEEIRRRRLGEQAARELGNKFTGTGKGKGFRPALQRQILITTLSMLLSFVVATLVWGWKFAAGIVGLIFVHECGHVWAARRRHLTVENMIFVPLLGAFVTTRRFQQDLEEDAFVAIMGPIFGAAGSLVCIAIAYITGLPYGMELGIWNLGINLFNLIPMKPLDGSMIAPVLVARTRKTRYDRSGSISADAKWKLSLAYIGLALLLGLAVYKLSEYPYFPSSPRFGTPADVGDTAP